MSADFVAAKAAANLRRWQESGLPRQWVEARHGQWDHGAWEQLLVDLRKSEFWPLDPGGVGRALAEQQREWENLQRWLASGQPRRWVEMHGGRWGHGDWSSLLEYLRYSEFWPVAPAAVGGLLERLGQEWRNLRRWQDSGDPRSWVAEQQGDWDHAGWLGLVDTLRHSAFWPLDLADVGRTVEELKRGYDNVQRWRESGQARPMVERYAGRGGQAARLALLDALQRTEFWPMDPGALDQAVEEIQAEVHSLRRWEESGAAAQWIEEHKGQWSQVDWRALVTQLRHSEFWPLDIEAVGRRLGQLRLEWWNLDRWRVSGLARRWVEAHQGEWSEEDWQALLVDLEKYHFWPIDTAALSRVLDEVRADWWKLRPWLQPGQALRSTEVCRGREDLRGLLESLRQAEFWPASAERQAAPARQAA